MLAHEAWHLHGETHEGVTNCYAFQSGVALGRALGLSEGTAARMMRQQLVDNATFAQSAPEYLVPHECRNGGRLDLAPAGNDRFPLTARRSSDADEQEHRLDERDREPVQHRRAERDGFVDDREQQPVHRRLPHAEPRGGEDREHRDDRADGADAAEVRDRGDAGSPPTDRSRKKRAAPPSGHVSA